MRAHVPDADFRDPAGEYTVCTFMVENVFFFQSAYLECPVPLPFGTLTSPATFSRNLSGSRPFSLLSLWRAVLQELTGLWEATDMFLVPWHCAVLLELLAQSA